MQSPLKKCTLHLALSKKAKKVLVLDSGMETGEETYKGEVANFSGSLNNTKDNLPSETGVVKVGEAVKAHDASLTKQKEGRC